MSSCGFFTMNKPHTNSIVHFVAVNSRDVVVLTCIWSVQVCSVLQMKVHFQLCNYKAHKKVKITDLTAYIAVNLVGLLKCHISPEHGAW